MKGPRRLPQRLVRWTSLYGAHPLFLKGTVMSKKKRVLWPILTIMIIAVGASVLALARNKSVATVSSGRESLSTSGRFGSANDFRSIATRSPALSVQTNTNSGQAIAATMEVERITIKRSGFEPSEIRRPAGPFFLAFDNHGKLGEVFLEIYPANGQRLHDLNAKKGQLRQGKIIDLPPGQYVLTEVNHPRWNCRIFISAK